MTAAARRIAVVDYGAGNLASIHKALAAVGCEPLAWTAGAPPVDIAGIVVPGVGHFGATSAIDGERRESILRHVAAGRPLLGICLGMQWLFSASAEARGIRGLGLLSGCSTRIRADRPLKVPHVGWNALVVASTTPLIAGIADGAQVYFTHSFAVAESDCAVATAVHGQPFVAAVQCDHVCGVQFHPEKSGEVGLRILRNFAQMTRS